MTWTHNVIGTELNGDTLRILVDYTDGTNIFHDSLYTMSSVGNIEWLKAQIQIKLDQLNAIYSFDVPTGVIDLTPASVPTATPKMASAQSSIASGGSSDTIYVVTTGKKLTITDFSAGGASSSSTLAHSSSQKMELFYDPNGNGTGMTLIDVIYCDGLSNQFNENFTTDTGNGTISIRMRRTNFASVSLESFVKWQGSEI